MKHIVTAHVSPIYNTEPAVRESVAACLHNIAKALIHEGVFSYEVRTLVMDDPDGGKSILCEAIWPDKFDIELKAPDKQYSLLSRLFGSLRRKPSM